MTRLITIFYFLPLFSFSQNWQWTKKEGGTSIDNGHSICTDGMGNCYASVDSSGQAKILKYNSIGNSVWKVNTWYGSARSIVSDNSGYLYVAGDSSNQIMVAKYDTGGNMIWRINGGTGHCNGISLDNSGHFYLTGFTTFLQKYDTAGNQIWIRNVSATGNSICTDNLANCYITGKFSGTASFGINNLTALGTQDLFITKYDSSGNCLWAKQVGGNCNCNFLTNDCGYAVTADNLGSIYFTGSIVDTVNFDSFTFIADHDDIFLAKYDVNGNAVWVRQASGWVDEEGRCIAIDNQSNILIGGSYVPTVNFSGFMLTGWGNYDAFVAKYDSNGNFLNAIKAGGPTWNEYIYGICYDNSGNTFVTGSFSGTTYFGMDSLISSGIDDIFIGKINFLTDIEKIEKNSFDVDIYPNPSNGSFTIETDNKINVREIRITDLAGRIIFQMHPINQRKLSIDNLQSGTYFVTLIDKDNRMTNRKIISCSLHQIK